MYSGTQPEAGEGRVHHDVGRLEDGTTVAIRGWLAERAPGDTFSYDTIDVFETATETSLWTWSTLDHLDPPAPPVTAWTHANAVTVDLAGRVAYLACRNLNLILKADMDTDDLLWRFGEGEGGDFTLTSGEWFYKCHDPEILPGGRILLYDNGNGRPGGNSSRAVEYELDESTMTATQVWQYDGPPKWYTPIWGDADRLENGNTLITAGARDEGVQSRIFEVTPSGVVVWSVTLPEYYGVYRAERYASIDGG
ncbi:MAG: aryl-sulfate sulfotransferase [Deltaproteobacteria bacterium]|nr:aryl-sulfate sulfotransferase [Deltaproteobacteria bacterium]